MSGKRKTTLKECTAFYRRLEAHRTVVREEINAMRGQFRANANLSLDDCDRLGNLETHLEDTTKLLSALHIFSGYLE